MKRILAPIDFSDVSNEVLKEAAKMASAFGASITLLHVIGLEADMAGFGGDAPFMNLPLSKDVVELRKMKSHERLEEYAKDLVEQNLQVDCEVAIEYARPANAVLESVKNCGADLIVIGTHGHGALFHLLLGGVAETVVHRAPCPVLVVHSLPEEERPKLVNVSTRDEDKPEE